MNFSQKFQTKGMLLLFHSIPCCLVDVFTGFVAPSVQKS